MFSPLAIAYSQELDAFLHRSQGLSSFSKRDFFRLCWNVYNKSFTADNIASSWSKTGLYPLDPETVMQLFEKPLTSTEIVRASSQSSSSQSAISTSDWRSIRALVSEVVTGVHGIHDKRVQKLNNTILSLTTEIALLKSQNNGYKQAIFDEKKKKRKRGRGLFEEVRAQDGQGATFFSSRKIKAAKDLLTQKEHAEEQEQRDRVAQKEARKRLQQQQQQQAEKEVRKVERAQKASQRKEEVALQTRQRQLAKDTRIAANSFNPSREEPLQKLKRPTKRTKHLPEYVVASHTPSSQRAMIQPATRAGRITRRPNHPSDYHIDI
jgi:hypothetical protein